MHRIQRIHRQRPCARHHRTILEVLCPCLNGSEPNPINVGASMNQTCSSASYGCSIGLGSGEYGGQFHDLSSFIPWTVLEQFTVWQGVLSSHWGVLLPQEGVLGLQQFLSGWCVWSGFHMKAGTWRFPSRTFDCSEMFSDIHFTCHLWF